MSSNINDIWKNAYKCSICKDTGWILFDKAVPEIYRDNIPVTFAKRCSCGYREATNGKK